MFLFELSVFDVFFLDNILWKVVPEHRNTWIYTYKLYNMWSSFEQAKSCMCAAQNSSLWLVQQDISHDNQIVH